MASSAIGGFELRRYPGADDEMPDAWLYTGYGI
jgi:hypothetical protein